MKKECFKEDSYFYFRSYVRAFIILYNEKKFYSLINFYAKLYELIYSKCIYIQTKEAYTYTRK